ncbi:hypothetical protein CDAR_539201 [Caerostris darwini]|uniref:Uncharacterized protein n=1 Tax=Caerostris darwini TaxID=1538125 RepID=A0AAV4T0I6_9ARAC|nr:hypothetical protein CDAR_539201 [Caerostris darwini]
MKNFKKVLFLSVDFLEKNTRTVNESVLCKCSHRMSVTLVRCSHRSRFSRCTSGACFGMGREATLFTSQRGIRNHPHRLLWAAGFIAGKSKQMSTH